MLSSTLGRALSCSILRVPDFVTVERLGLTIDNGSFVPYYMQIVDHVRELIKKNKLKPRTDLLLRG